MQEAPIVTPMQGSTIESIASGFHLMAVQFLEASAANWPSDVLIPIALSRVKAMSPLETLSGFDANFGRYVERLSRREVEALMAAADEPLVSAINGRAKFEASNGATRETIWSYVCNLCKFHSVAKLYHHIPAPVMGAVNEAAANLKRQLDSGQLDMSQINPFELGQQVISKFDPADLDRMMKDMFKNPDAMNAVMAQMSGLMGGSSGGPAAAGSGLGALQGLMGSLPGMDLSSMFSMMGAPPGLGPTGPKK